MSLGLRFLTGLLIGDPQEYVGMAGLIEWTPAGEVLAAQFLAHKFSVLW